MTQPISILHLEDSDMDANLSSARELQLEVPFIFVSGTIGEEVAIDTIKSGATVSPAAGISRRCRCRHSNLDPD